MQTGLKGNMDLLRAPTVLEEDVLQPCLGAEGAFAVWHVVSVGFEGPIEVLLVAHQKTQLLLGNLLHFMVDSLAVYNF